MISSFANAKVKYVRRLQAEKRFRLKENVFVVEGTRWISELIQLSRIPNIVFYTDEWLNAADNETILQQLAGIKQAVTEQIMQAMSDTQTPPGILAVLPVQALPWPEKPSFLLILDQIMNPGNLGTMLRTAGAAGVEGVILGPGCVNAYNPKAVRGSMGAHLRLPILAATWPEIKKLVQDMSVWLAAADGDLAYTAVPWTQPSALIIGGEADGAGSQARKLATSPIAIPMHAATESLNAAVAAAVILFEAARQRRETSGK
ncbi:MAG: RNA methyltransferase [Ardenticatenaceae bacterium]|nr:RNA methyltransferase [Ardenticatenaceae bacterium]MCB9442644.1 RNA methyltransferase [Ardenticatenaceae bacterium]